MTEPLPASTSAPTCAWHQHAIIRWVLFPLATVFGAYFAQAYGVEQVGMRWVFVFASGLCLIGTAYTAWEIYLALVKAPKGDARSKLVSKQKFVAELCAAGALVSLLASFYQAGRAFDLDNGSGRFSLVVKVERMVAPELSPVVCSPDNTRGEVCRSIKQLISDITVSLSKDTPEAQTRKLIDDLEFKIVSISGSIGDKRLQEIQDGLQEVRIATTTDKFWPMLPLVFALFSSAAVSRKVGLAAADHFSAAPQLTWGAACKSIRQRMLPPCYVQPPKE